MRKVIGIGETILDIIFRHDNPTSAVPGGSTFNTMISLGRAGVPATFVTDLGDDHVGTRIRTFMKDNGVDDAHVCIYPETQSPVSLAFLDDTNSAHYEFYRQLFPEAELDLPDITADDIIIFGSYYALNPLTRSRVSELLDRAHEAGAIIIYDVNFRANHQAEAVRLTGTLLENLEYADIVRGSSEDFLILYGPQMVGRTATFDSNIVYRDHVSFYCPRLLCTQGADGVDLHAGTLHKHYDSLPVDVVSTIGAGDSFNAGLIYGLLRSRIRRDDLDTLTEADWDTVVRYALAFSADTCASLENYIRPDFQP